MYRHPMLSLILKQVNQSCSLRYQSDKNRSSNWRYRNRTNYKYFLNVQTRWRDNDVYGHVNNVVYGEWIDTIVNQYLIEKCSLIPQSSPLVGFVVSSHCEYYAPLSYPMKIQLGLSIHRLGNSSIDYLVGIFANEKEENASAVGGFRHVFVDRVSRRSQPIPDEIRKQILSISNLDFIEKK